MLAKVKYLPPNEREETVFKIAESAGTSTMLPKDLMMTDAQVSCIHSAGMEVGGHTVSHPILAKINNTNALEEISAGKATLEEITGSKISLFAYPNGKPGVDYLPEQVELVKNAGFNAAVSTNWGVASKHSDIYQLPRFTPWGSMQAFIPKLLLNLRH